MYKYLILYKFVFLRKLFLQKLKTRYFLFGSAIEIVIHTIYLFFFFRKYRKKVFYLFIAYIFPINQLLKFKYI